MAKFAVQLKLDATQTGELSRKLCVREGIKPSYPLTIPKLLLPLARALQLKASKKSRK